MKKKSYYQVLVHGSIFFESDNELIAKEYARLIKSNWTDVKIITVKKRERG